ncbi:MAG TPA: WYL domain-containing protein, partial [Polyangiaceae bacterium]|nr:WYL domain-containing protein [Polyangiaceae bacterium]
VDVPDEKVGVAGAITMSLAAAFGRVFTGSAYGAEFVRLRNSVVQRLAEFRKQQFADMTRKFVVIGGREELLEDKEALLDQLLDALLRERLLRIRYENFDGVAKQRVVEPYSLAVYDSHLYLFARDVEDTVSGVRTFRFARLRSAQALSETFAYPSPNEYDPEVLLRDSVGIWLGQEEPCTVRVRLSSGWAVFARHHRWHDSQRLVRELEDGSVELELRVRTCPELEQWILKFGESAEVLAPSELRNRVASRLRQAAARYESRVSP